MNFLIELLQKEIESWREGGYDGIYPETRRILLNIHNDGNPFLYLPQIRAIETYIYLKEIKNNISVIDLMIELVLENKSILSKIGFSKERIDDFSDFTEEKQKEKIRKALEENNFTKYEYPNFVFALTMGSGKTILMGVLMMYEFIISKKHSGDKRFAKNLLVLGPADTSIIEVLKEIKLFDYSLVLPKDLLNNILMDIKYWYLEKPETEFQAIGNYNVIVSNSSKIIKREWKNEFKGNELFQLRKNPINKRLSAIQELEDLAVFVDEAHHSYGEDVSEKLNKSRETIHHLAENTNMISVLNFTGTPYVKNEMLRDTIYVFNLKDGIEKGILKQPIITNHGSREDVQSQDFVEEVVQTFWSQYGEKRVDGKLPKIAFYTTDIDMLNELDKNLSKTLLKLKISLSKKVSWHSKYTGDEKKESDYEFSRLDTEGSEKQFILLVNKGTEGWNCKSLFAVALYKNSTSNNFVLQASSRCLRKIGKNDISARIFLSDENYELLDRDLKNSFNTSIGDITNKKQEETPVEIKVLKKTKLKVKKQIVKVIQSKKNDISKVKLNIDLDKNEKEEIKREIKESGIILEKGLARFVDIDEKLKKKLNIIDVDIVKKEKDLTFYEIVSFIKNRTHLKYSEIMSLLENNKIDKKIDFEDKINKDNDKVHKLINEILSKYITYQKETEEVEIEIELTKSYPFNILLKKRENKEEDFLTEEEKELKNKEYYESNLVVYKKYEEENGDITNLGFHLDPYNFDSEDELQVFRYLRSNLSKGEGVKDVYFTGGITNEKHNDFYFEYLHPTDKDIRKYFPDFLIETTKGRYLVLEVKSEREKLTYNKEKEELEVGKIITTKITSEPLMKEIGFKDFQKLNKNYEYKIIFNGKVESNKRSILEEINKL